MADPSLLGRRGSRRCPAHIHDARPPSDAAALLDAIRHKVPRGSSVRDDVVQDIALAVLEGRCTADDLTATSIRSFRREANLSNFEAGGYARSFDAVDEMGRTLHDRIAADGVMAP